MKRKYLKFFLFLMLGCFAPLLAIGEPSSTTKISKKRIPIVTDPPIPGKIYPLAIIGAGAAGIMAFERAVLNNDEVLLFAGAKKEFKNSRGTWVRTVDNIPGFEKFKRTVLELRNQTLTSLHQGPFGKNLFVIEDSVLNIEKNKDGHFLLKDGQRREYLVQYVILATGAMDVQPEINGSIRPILPYANHQSVAYCLRCDGHRILGKEGAVIGYSDDAANTAIILVERYHPPKMTILTNGNKPQWSEASEQLLKSYGISVKDQPIQDIIGVKKEGILQGFRLKDGEKISAQMAFVSLGLRVNNQLALQMGARVDERGLVITDENGESSVPGIFAVGDLRANSMKQIYSGFVQGALASDAINKLIRQKKR